MSDINAIVARAFFATRFPPGFRIGRGVATNETTYGYQVFASDDGAVLFLDSVGNLRRASEARTARLAEFAKLVDEVYGHPAAVETPGATVHRRPEPLPEPVRQKMPDGFIEWHGRDPSPPDVGENDIVEVIFRGDPELGAQFRAGDRIWMYDPEVPLDEDIVGYRIVERAPKTVKHRIFEDVIPTLDLFDVGGFERDDVAGMIGSTPAILELDAGRFAVVENAADWINTNAEDVYSFVSLSGFTYWDPADRPGMTTVMPADIAPTDEVEIATFTKTVKRDAWSVDWSDNEDPMTRVLAYRIL